MSRNGNVFRGLVPHLTSRLSEKLQGAKRPCRVCLSSVGPGKYWTKPWSWHPSPAERSGSRTSSVADLPETTSQKPLEQELLELAEDGSIDNLSYLERGLWSW